jgi:hypothetical protein
MREGWQLLAELLLNNRLQIRSGPSSEIDIKGRIYEIPELDIENMRD